MNCTQCTKLREELSQWKRDFRDVQERGEAMEKALRRIADAPNGYAPDVVTEMRRVARGVLEQ